MTAFTREQTFEVHYKYATIYHILIHAVCYSSYMDTEQRKGYYEDVVRCYEYLKCGQTECPMYGKKDGPECWEVDETLCVHHVIEEVRKGLSGIDKKETCKLWGCLFYKAANPK